MLTPIIATAFTAIVLPYLLYKAFFAGPKVDLSHLPMINPTAKTSWFSKRHNDRFMAEATKLVKEGQKKVCFTLSSLEADYFADSSNSTAANPSALQPTKAKKS
jgi:hypothetical protein